MLTSGDTLAFGSVAYAVEIVSDAELATLDPEAFVSGRTLFGSSKVSFVKTRDLRSSMASRLLPPDAPITEPEASPPSPRSPARSPDPIRQKTPEPAPIVPPPAPLQPTKPMSAEQIASAAKETSPPFRTMFWLGMVGVGCLAIAVLICVILLIVLYLRTRF